MPRIEEMHFGAWNEVCADQYLSEPRNSRWLCFPWLWWYPTTDCGLGIPIIGSLLWIWEREETTQRSHKSHKAGPRSYHVGKQTSMPLLTDMLNPVGESLICCLLNVSSCCHGHRILAVQVSASRGSKTFLWTVLAVNKIDHSG